MDYLRRYVLLKFSESLTDEERQFLAGQESEKKHAEVMSELKDIRRRQNFGVDFAANVTGSAAYDAFIWLARKLIKSLR